MHNNLTIENEYKEYQTNRNDNNKPLELTINNKIQTMYYLNV